MLELRGVNTFYGSIPALRDVSLSVREGEIVHLDRGQRRGQNHYTDDRLRGDSAP